MAALVGEDTTQPDITFLYKLKQGACPSSYGLKVAALAGIPNKIRERAAVAATGMSVQLDAVFGQAVPPPLAILQSVMRSSSLGYEAATHAWSMV
eukprot:scaffold6844_cov357-Prasinococcus_capsulatus_cf.AAC.4